MRPIVLVIAALLSACSGERPETTPVSAEQVVKLEKVVDYDAAVGNYISELTGIWVSMYELDVIMEQIAYDNVPYADHKIDIEGFLVEREVSVREVQKRIAELPNAPLGIIDRNQEIRDSSLRYAKNYAAEVLNLISEYKHQLNALERGDIDAYHVAISEQVDNTAIMIRAERELVKLTQSSQPPTSAEWFRQEAIIQSNTLIADFLDFLNQSESLSNENLNASKRQMRQSLRKNIAAVIDAEDALENFRIQIKKENKQEFVSVITFLDLNDQSIEVERRVVTIMRRYYNISAHYNAMENATETIAELDELGVELEATVNDRMEFAFARRKAALAMVKELSEH